MKRVLLAGFLATCFLTSGEFAPAPAQAATAQSLSLHVDASRAVQGLLDIHETIAVTPGPLTLVYPKWVPGEHAPNGPIANVTDLVISAGAKKLAWQRDPVNLYTFHVDVPAGVTSLDVDFTFLGNNIPGVSTARLATPTILSLEWNKVVLSPEAEDQRTVTITPSIHLPTADWKYATALETTTATGADVSFAPVTLETLVDSPLDAGLYERTLDLAKWDGAPVTIAAFADTPDELAAGDKTVAKFRALVEQMHALYHYRHFRHYTFLLTMSDEMPGEGLEHHQSSDDGTGGDFFTSEAALASNATLLPHEFNHSWDGKFRRPDGLATPNLQAPMIDDGLWVYEGMTQFYGELQAERAGLWTEQQYLDALAQTYARLDVERGRLADPLIDTARASSIRRGYAAWSSERRSQDYYAEGEMLWLEADVLIHKLSGGKKSLDDVALAFFGHGENTIPQVLPYTRADVIAALNAVQPYDWATFLAQRLDAIAPHPPNPFTEGGYALVYRDTPTAFEKLQNGQRKSVDMWWSLGIQARGDGTITDVLTDSPAGRAGIGPGLRIVAVNDRTFKGQDQVDHALREAKTGAPVRLIVTGGDVFREVTLDYRGGPRYPALQRVDGTSDILSAIAKPLATLP
jgi:predicted metalloprotease with PDZ domain